MLDVCLVLEGTYPYVAGGVSTWVHQLIDAFSHLRFGIIAITTHPDPTRTTKYPLPAHVVLLQETALQQRPAVRRRRRRPRPADWACWQRGMDDLIGGDSAAFARLLPLVRGSDACLCIRELLDDPACFAAINAWYDRYGAQESYLDFFWTFRGMLLPLFQILTTPLPPARIYHAVSTGYAGLLAAIGTLEHDACAFLTEHGIYTHERMLEIAQAHWIHERTPAHVRLTGELSFFKHWWTMLFARLSQIAYRHADRIFTLFPENQLRQEQNGADPGKITIIPNGIPLRDYQDLPRIAHPHPRIGCIGRVVGIKDVKTFLHAARIIHTHDPAAEFFLLGPTDEEPDYVAECEQLVRALHLESVVHIMGRVAVREYYPTLDVVALTSLSEGQPYVILEANAAGIPVVATDVGACRALLTGASLEDQALGTSGLVTAVGSAEQTAAAVLRLLADPAYAAQLGAAGRTRVARYYDQDDLLSRYLNAYEQVL